MPILNRPAINARLRAEAEQAKSRGAEMPLELPKIQDVEVKKAVKKPVKKATKKAKK